jgi:hypothetical protein
MSDQHEENMEWMRSLLAIMAAAVFALIRVFVIPEHPTPLLHLVSDLIPEAMVALLAVPVVYYILHKRGISAEQKLERKLRDVLVQSRYSSAEIPQLDTGQPILDDLKARFFHYHRTNDVDGSELWLCKVLDFRNSSNSSGMLKTEAIVERIEGDRQRYTFYATLVAGHHLMLVAERAHKDNHPAIEIYPFWAPQTDVYCSMRANVGFSNNGRLLSIGLLSKKRIAEIDEGPVRNKLQAEQLRSLWNERMDGFKILIGD